MDHDHNKIRPNLDIWGSIASLTCAIHCSILPIVLSFGILSGWSWLENEWIDFGFILISLFLVTWSLGSGYRSVHHIKTPLIIAICGFAIFAIGHFLFHELEIYLSTIGGLLITYSHYKNWKLNQEHVVACQVG